MQLEQEKVVKGYDPEIMRRLIAYLKPYTLQIVIALVSLLIATLGEIYLPIVLRNAVDYHILISFHEVLDESEEYFSEDILKETDSITIGRRLFIPNYALKNESSLNKTELQNQGIISEEEYFAFPVLSAAQEKIVVGNQDVMIYDMQNAAIRKADLERFSQNELRLIKQENFTNLKRLSFIFLGTLVLILIFSFSQTYFMAISGQGVMHDIRLELYKHSINQSLSYLQTQPVGKLVTRITNDVETVNEFFSTVFISLTKDVVLMLGVVGTLFFLDVRLGVIIVLTLPPVFIVTYFFRIKARDAFRTVRLWVSKVNTFLSEHISGMSIVQMFNQEKNSLDTFKTQNSMLMKANLGEMLTFAFFRPIIDLLSSISIAVMIFFGARFYLTGLISLGVLIAFINLIRKFYRPVMRISENFTLLQSAMAGGERIFEHLDKNSRIEDTGKISVAGQFRGEVVFENVNFSYNTDETVLHDLSFSIGAGETVAVVGYTGAGKTTIANLLTRLWDIDSGKITIDGIDIRDIPLNELRSVVQPVQQDVFLFSDTIGMNISLGKEFSDIELQETAKLVQSSDFIESLPERYESQLNERGINISSGQRQLISYARVLAQDPKIIVLDEATSNIDSETENKIQIATAELMKNRTALVIAHRLSTITHADRILVLSRGRLIEEGTHAELLEKKGYYYNLYKLQYSEIKG